jgi:hypothetical protein
MIDILSAENAKKKLGAILAKRYGVTTYFDKLLVTPPAKNDFAIQFTYPPGYTDSIKQEMTSHMQQALPGWKIEIQVVLKYEFILIGEKEPVRDTGNFRAKPQKIK